MSHHRLARRLAIAAAAAVFPFGALAAHIEGHDVQGHEHHEPAKAEAPGAGGAPQALSEASKAYEAAMQKMHKDMAIPYANDVDVDFVRGMIPHHQGAIDQANVLLKHSKDLRLRRLALGIIAAQKREIRFMVKWLKERDQGFQSSEMPDWLKAEPGASGSPAEGAAEKHLPWRGAAAAPHCRKAHIGACPWRRSRCAALSPPYIHTGYAFLGDRRRARNGQARQDAENGSTRSAANVRG